jgi:carbonic anhydrase
MNLNKNVMKSTTSNTHPRRKGLKNAVKGITFSTMVAGALILTSCNMETSNNADQATQGGDMNANYVTQTSETQDRMTPEMAIKMLKEGNARFTADEMINRDLMAQVKQTGSGQYPFAAVVSCIDSRIPTEIVFDQGVGDIFNARVAGNFVNTDILGSLEFATKVAGSKAVVVMGHTECGAVKGACDNVELGNLTPMLANIMPAVEGVTDITENRNSKNAAFVQKVADLNVELTIDRIMSDSQILREMYENGEIAIVGAMYDVHTGKVSFMD